jgi:hypothetical protein
MTSHGKCRAATMTRTATPLILARSQPTANLAGQTVTPGATGPETPPRHSVRGMTGRSSYLAAVHDYAGWLTDRQAELAPRADEANAPLDNRTPSRRSVLYRCP